MAIIEGCKTGKDKPGVPCGCGLQATSLFSKIKDAENILKKGNPENERTRHEILDLLESGFSQVEGDCGADLTKQKSEMVEINGLVVVGEFKDALKRLTNVEAETWNKMIVCAEYQTGIREKGD